MELLIITTIATWLKGKGIVMLLTFVFGILASKGFTRAIKKFSKRGAVVTKELGEFFTETSGFFQTLDNSIKDDGKLKENSIPELIKEGKEVIAEGKDVYISIRPKQKRK